MNPSHVVGLLFTANLLLETNTEKQEAYALTVTCQFDRLSVL